MSNNALRAEQAAIAAIENIFVEAGWSDGNCADRETILHPASPLFFHGATPAEASSSLIVVDGVGRNIYAVYAAVDVPTSNAGGRYHHAEPIIAITIYYSDVTVFDADSVFNKYLEGLLDGLAAGDWAISYDPGENRISASDREPYIYSKVILATTIF
ncbi:MAG: hypothetical protein IJ894_08460 [Bacteroidales bacterium]|nr:hypothetical protein [Bacteroidales bacterium]